MWATAGTSALVALVALASVAHAQTPTEADIAFKNGRDLLKAGKFADACREFEKSNALDPQLGTRFNIAQCDEKIGKLASALVIYRDLAANDTNAKRKQASVELVAQLGSRVPRLVVQVAGSPPHLAVVLAGAGQASRSIQPNQPVELDTGDYTVVVHADGMLDYTGKVAVHDEGRTNTLAVVLAPAPVIAAPTTAAPVHVDEPPPAEPPHSHRKLFAYGAIGLGGAALAGGVVAGVLASGKWSDAKNTCGGSTTCATPDQLASADALRDQARSRANLSTGLVIAGALIAGGGVALWLTAPSEHALAVTPSAGGNEAGLILSGRF